MDLDTTRMMLNIRHASTEDLLLRSTVERGGMEPEALDLVEDELDRRGVTPEERAEFAADHADCLRDTAGLPLRCSFCIRPARREAWGWHRLWGWIPVFPRVFRYCREHGPSEE